MAKRTQTSQRDWQDLEHELLGRLDLHAEFLRLGIRYAGQAKPDGWVPCYAHERLREDRSASAAVNIHTGCYVDHGGPMRMSLWDLAAHLGVASDWRQAREHYARQVGLEFGKPRDPAGHLRFPDKFSGYVASTWCRRKNGDVPVEALREEAILEAGGRTARYYCAKHWYSVIALPVFGERGVSANPVGWLLWEAGGRELPVFNARPVKMKLTAGSRSGLIGLGSLLTLESEAAVQRVWLVEGPADALALRWLIPEDQRAANPVITNSDGCGKRLEPWMLERLSGHRVVLVRDADVPGERSGQQWAPEIARYAEEVRWPRLPYPVQPKHGKDLRDWISSGGTWEGLLGMVTSAVPIAAEAEGPVVAEAEGDPDRLARVVLRAYQHDDGLRLRYWQGEWLRWEDGRYLRTPVKEMAARIWSLVKEEFDRLYHEKLAEGKDREEPLVAKSVSTSLVTNVMAALASRTVLSTGPEVDLPYWIDGRRLGRDFFAMQNGILDLDALLADRDDVLLPRSPQWLSLARAPYAFDPAADCPRWKETLRVNLQGDEANLARLQEFAGYLLTWNTDAQSFLLVEGEGANGKSVFLAGIRAMLGSENCSSLSLEDFGRQFMLQMMLGKLANISGDSGEIDRADEGKLKTLTDGTLQAFDRKNLDPIAVRPTARLLFAVNRRPNFVDSSDAVWRRMEIVPFTRRVEEHEKVLGMDKPQWWYEAGEAPGILNWAIQGLARWRQQRGFTRSAEGERRKQAYRISNNPTLAYLSEFCQADPEAATVKAELYREYCQWCKESNCHPLGRHRFYEEVGKKFPGSADKDVRVQVGVSRKAAFAGVRLVDPEVTEEF